MKVILYMAISLNGVIARENNDEDFLSDENWDTFVELVNKVGCVIWGRKTLEIVGGWNKRYLEGISKAQKVVVSSDEKLKLEKGYVKATSPQNALDLLSKQGFKEAIVSGGSKLNSSFAKEGLIDEIIINIDPVVVGKGIPLFSSEDFDLNLKLLEYKKIADNRVQLRYKVKR